MLASIPASMLNQNPPDLGIPNRIDLKASRFSLGLPMACRHSPRRRRAVLDSASDSFCTGSQIVAMLKVGSLQRANRVGSWTIGRHHQSAPFIAFINELAPALLNSKSSVSK